MSGRPGRPVDDPSGSVRPQSGLPVELFRTPKAHWALDTATVTFVRVDEVAYDVLAILREGVYTPGELLASLPQHAASDVLGAVHEIDDARTHGRFPLTHFDRTLRSDHDQHRQILTDAMGGLTVSVTSRCNLGCSYCILGGNYDRHPVAETTTMTWPVLQATMQFLVDHSARSPSLRVVFFGGEPLLAFPLLARAVAFLHEQLAGRRQNLEVVVVTNGTVMSPAILDFLADNHVILQVSLDGDQQSHDADRRFIKGGRGTHAAVLATLTRILEHDADYFRSCVRVKTVIKSAQPTEAESVFAAPPLDQLPPEHFSSVLLEPQFDVARDDHFWSQLSSLEAALRDHHGATSVEDLLSDLSWTQRQFFWMTYGRFFALQAVPALGIGSPSASPFSKSCLIGWRDANVSPDGRITVCDKAQSGVAFVIGDVVENCWDFAAIDRLYGALTAVDQCGTCFARRFCDLCFEKLDGSSPTAMRESAARFCAFTREVNRRVLQVMLEVLDENPDVWSSVRDYVDERVRLRRKELTGRP